MRELTHQMPRTSRNSRIAERAATIEDSAANDTADYALLSMQVVTVGARGQIVIPAEIRQQCHFHPHAKLLIFRIPGDAAAVALVRLSDIGSILESYGQVRTALPAGRSEGGANER